MKKITINNNIYYIHPWKVYDDVVLLTSGTTIKFYSENGFIKIKKPLNINIYEPIFHIPNPTLKKKNIYSHILFTDNDLYATHYTNNYVITNEGYRNTLYHIIISEQQYIPIHINGHKLDKSDITLPHLDYTHMDKHINNAYENAYYFIHPWENKFNEFLIHQLPRLQLFFILKQTIPDLKLLISDTLPESQLKCIEILKITDIIIHNKKDILKINNIYVPNHPTQQFKHSNINRLSQQLINNVNLIRLQHNNIYLNTTNNIINNYTTINSNIIKINELINIIYNSTQLILHEGNDIYLLYFIKYNTIIYYISKGKNKILLGICKELCNIRHCKLNIIKDIRYIKS
jgi:hypothetical protein